MADLVVKDLQLRLGENEILKGVSLNVTPGQVVALLGPSGSGKTTLLRAVAGLEQPHAGAIAISDQVFFDASRGIDLPAEQRGLGLVFQSYALWPHRTVFGNVAYGLRLRNAAAADIKARVEKTLGQIGLGHLAERYPHQLSGGQQQRVAIARALVYEPPVILLDEPLSNLDAKLREEARAWLRTLIVTLGLSAIHVTHDQVEAMAIADRIILLEGGVVAQEGPPTALYNEPATLFAAEFMGSNNRLDGKLLDISGGQATMDVFGERISGMARTKAAPGRTVVGVIRLERVRCATGPGPNRIKMVLKAPMYLGERWELVFARENLTVRAYASAPLPSGEHYVEFPRDALWVF
ncbi:MAG TPA: ABC transporter ATP-binding protein [Xanthobacteraceae bacterium]|nr:ABC transporter ATP-binding protein [Xanthobacteraceae bacterium]